MEEKKKRGRPAIQPEQRLVLRSIRLSPAQWEKIDKYGIAWLRALIDKARPPKSHPQKPGEES